MQFDFIHSHALYQFSVCGIPLTKLNMRRDRATQLRLGR